MAKSPLATLEQYIIAVLDSQEINLQFNDVHTNVHALQNIKGGYNELISILSERSENHGRKRHDELVKTPPENVLQFAGEKCEYLRLCASTINSHFFYMSENIKERKLKGGKCTTFSKLILHEFARQFFQEFKANTVDPKESSIFKELNLYFARAREGQISNHRNVLLLMNFFFLLQTEIDDTAYGTIFCRYMKDAGEFYSQWAKKESIDMKALEFYRKVYIYSQIPPVFQTDEQSKDRVQLFDKTINLYGSHLLQKDGAFVELCEEHHRIELREIYLCSELNVQATEILKETFRKYIEDCYNKYLTIDVIDNAKEWMTNVLAIFNNLTSITIESFKEDKRFDKIRGDTQSKLFIYTIGLPRCLAIYMDTIIREIKDVDQRKKIIDSCVELYKFIGSKDVFTKLYVNPYLVGRLLERVCEIADEEDIINKLSNDGPSTTFTMKQTISDYLQAQKTITEHINPDPDFRIRKVNMNKSVFYSFQTYSIESLVKDIRVPEAFSVIANTVTRVYQKSHQNNDLKWVWKEGFCQLSYTTNNKGYIIRCTTLQAIILIYLNEQGLMKFSDLCDLIKYEARLLTNHLHALIFKKLISIDPKQITPDTKLYINPDFNSPSKSIIIGERKGNFRIQNSEDEATKTFRDQQLEACIVRYMKQNNQANKGSIYDFAHQFLLNHFHVKKDQVNRILENLVGKEYLNRKANDEYEYRR